jgi:predicted MPP superfamily phosphohydrolase
MTRRAFFHSVGRAGAALVASASYPCFFEPRWLEVTQRRVNLRRPRRIGPIRILHLSDLHLSAFVSLGQIESAVSLGLAQKPDLVCLTGDFITGQEDLGSGAYAKVLARLSTSAPTLAVLGNHDGGSWAEAGGGYADHRVIERLLDQSGIELLHNRARPVQVRGATLSLVGVGDLFAGEIDAVRAFSGADTSLATLLLSHNPDSKDLLGAYPWDLMLSGHTHGGQVVFPFIGPHYAPVRDKRYVSGLHPWGSRQIHVTRGIGNVAGIRFGCRPEVSLLRVS